MKRHVCAKTTTDPITVNVTNQVNVPQIIDFCQTFSGWSSGWVIPRRRANRKGKWTAIPLTKLAKVSTPRQGLRFALWRMRNYLDRLHDQYGRKLWTVTPIEKTTKNFFNKETGFSTYHRVFSFTARRNKTDFIGGA